MPRHLPMGWAGWNDYFCNYGEQTIKDQGRRLGVHRHARLGISLSDHPGMYGSLIFAKIASPSLPGFKPPDLVPGCRWSQRGVPCITKLPKIEVHFVRLVKALRGEGHELIFTAWSQPKSQFLVRF